MLYLMRKTLEEESNHYCSEERLKHTPEGMLLPIFTVLGNTDTKNGEWDFVHESDKVRTWAFLKKVSELQQENDGGMEDNLGLLQKLKRVLSAIEVLILGITEKKALWHDLRRSSDTSHEDSTFGVERNTVRYKFLSKMEASEKADREKEAKKKMPRR